MNPFSSSRNSERIIDKATDVARTLRLVWSAGRGWTLLWGVLLIVQGVLPVATVQLTRSLVDSLSGAVGAGGGWIHFRPVLIQASLMAAVLLLTEILQQVSEWVRTAQSEFIQDHISRLVQDRSVSVDIGFYETSAFHDRLHRARADAVTRPLALLESSGSALQNGITLVAMAAVLLPYGIWLPPVLLLSTLPAFYVVLRSSRRQHAWWNDTTVDRRRAQYFDILLTESFYAGEVRLFELAKHFQTAYQALRTQFRKERLSLLTAQYRARFAAELTAFAISGVAMVWMLFRAVNGAVTLGDVALFYQAFQRGQGLVRTLLGNLGQVYTNGLYMTNLFEFLDLKPEIVDAADAVSAPTRLRSGIRFENVCFAYPGSGTPSLQNFNAFFPAGKIIAVIGENGAGKTTLLKLLARLYDPDSGNVELDNIDIRRISLKSLRSIITFMFQVPGNYQFTVRENIGLGSVDGAHDLAQIQRAAWGAGADEMVQRLPNGYDSLLGRAFPGGTGLSGGEWQRISLARAFMRQAHVMLLDEPTSAMDSWAEADWYSRLRRFAEGRTVILATHRLTIAMRADLIYVMRAGQVVESGTHEQLLGLEGLYTQSWNMQTRSRVSVELQVTSA